MKKEFPKIIYIVNEHDKDGTIIPMASHTFEGIENGDKVGIYELKHIKKMVVTEELK